MRLHVLGGGPWQAPTVEKARSLGHWVLLTDPGPDRPAFRLADAHEAVDVLDVAATLDAARRHRVDGILADTSDVCVPTAARVAETLGLPGIGSAVAERCTRKDLMRQAAAAAGCASPACLVLQPHQGAETLLPVLAPPWVVKPADSQSGRGVRVVPDAAAVSAAIGDARAQSRCGLVIVESCVSGVEHIVDGLVVDGAAHVLAIASKLADPRNPTVATRIAYLSGGRHARAEQRLAPVVHRMVSALGLRQGPFHAEFIVEGERVVPIDFAARGGGVAIYQRAAPHVSGVDLMAASIALALGQRPAVQPAERRGACIEFLQLPPGRHDLGGGRAAAARLPGVAAVHLAGAGPVAGGTPRHKDERPGWVLALADDTETAIARARAACECLGAGSRPLELPPETTGDA